MGLCFSRDDDNKNKTHLLEVMAEHEAGINCTALSEDGSVLVTGSEDRTARLWSTRSPQCECIGVLRGHEDYINCVLFEDMYVLTGSADKTIRKWDISTCECVLIYRGHNSLINRLICAGDFVFTSSYDRTIRCWDFETGECIRVFRGHKRGVYPMIFIPTEEEDLKINSYDWYGNQDLLISGSADFSARLWSFETGKCLKQFTGHTGAVTCMATNPLGTVLFTGSTDNTTRSWNILKGEPLKVFEGHQSAVISLTVVNKIMYTASSDHTGRSWVTEFGDCTRVYKGHKHSVSCIKYHEGLIFTGCGDAIGRVYDAKSATLKRQFKGHEGAINALNVVDTYVFTSSHDGTLRKWDMSGIKDDTAFGRDEIPRKTTDNKDMIRAAEEDTGGDPDVGRSSTSLGEDNPAYNTNMDSRLY